VYKFCFFKCVNLCRCAEARAAANALASADAQASTARRDLDAALSDSDKKEKELGRLRRHLLDMEDEDDDKEDAVESRMECIRREQEEEHRAAMVGLHKLNSDPELATAWSQPLNLTL
jgi:predicted  nucleic acid-binding Zn-ribbon protein